MGFWCAAIVQPPNLSEQNGCVRYQFFLKQLTFRSFCHLNLQPKWPLFLKGQPPKTRPNFQSKLGAPIWVPGINKLKHLAYFALGLLGIVRVSPLPRCIGCITTRILIFFRLWDSKLNLHSPRLLRGEASQKKTPLKFNSQIPRTWPQARWSRRYMFQVIFRIYIRQHFCGCIYKLVVWAIVTPNHYIGKWLGWGFPVNYSLSVLGSVTPVKPTHL